MIASDSSAAPLASPARAQRRSRLREIGPIRLVALLGTLVIAAGVGGWAYLLPREFYDAFPIVLGSWISQDGPFNEHLIRDHGAQYLALGAASIAAFAWPSTVVFRMLAVAWTTFAVLYLGYHVTHLEHMTASESVALVTTLVVVVLLSAGLAVPRCTGTPDAT